MAVMASSEQILEKLKSEYESCHYWSTSSSLDFWEREKFKSMAKMLALIIESFDGNFERKSWE